MSKKLTEEMVIARTKISDLSKIKRLNCWGSELVDVSILRRMPNVEVLSLSVNSINSLQDVAMCKRLEELYMRQNNIRDLNQVVYLQNLPNLKNLWLAENPCAETDGYRLAVLRALPQLQKLDNMAVTQDELKEAQRKGRSLNHPESETQESSEDDIAYDTGYKYEEEYVPVRSASRQDNEYDIDDAEENYTNEKENDEEEQPSQEGNVQPQLSPTRRLLPQQQQPQPQYHERPRSYSPAEGDYDRRKASYDHANSKQSHHYYERPFSNITEETSSQDNIRESRISTSQSMSNMQDYANGDRYAPNVYRQSEGSEYSYRPEGPIRSASQHNCNLTHRPPFQRRPVTRNSNILSAVLCLVKELDYPSLEVVEMAVRCRMDQFADD